MDDLLQEGDVVQAVGIHGTPIDIYGVITHVMDTTGAVVNPYSGRWTTGNYFMGQTRADLKLILRITDMHDEVLETIRSVVT